MHVNKLHAILKAGGLKRRQAHSTRVRGYKNVEPGYHLSEQKRDNPEYAGFGFRRNLPRYLGTGVYDIRHDDLDKVKAILAAAGLEYETNGTKLIVDLNKGAE